MARRHWCARRLISRLRASTAAASTARLNDTGKLTAHMNASARGDTELGLRFAMRQIPNNKWKNVFEMMLASSPMKGGEITNLKVGDPSNTDNPFEVDFDVDGEQLLRLVGCRSETAACRCRHRSFLPTAPMTTARIPSPSSWAPSARPPSEVKLAIPSKYGVRLPIGVDVKRDYAEYHSTYKFEGGQLDGYSQDAGPDDGDPLRRRDDYASFRRTVDADQVQNIVLDNKSPGTAGLRGQSVA